MAEGATATFMGTSEFTDNSVLLKQLESVSCGENCTRTSRGRSYAVKKGGAIHNKVRTSFTEKRARYPCPFDSVDVRNDGITRPVTQHVFRR